MQVPKQMPSPERRAQIKLNMTSGKPKAWSHQDDLKALVGAEVRLNVRETGVVRGVLIAADQYTLKLRGEDAGRSFDMVISKSQLIYFSGVAS